MAGPLQIEPTTFELIVGQTIRRVEESGLFPPAVLEEIRAAAAAGKLSHAKAIDAILSRDLQEPPSP